MSWRVNIVMEPSLEAVRRAASVFRSTIAEFGGQETRQELELAFVEACTNSAVHGGSGPGDPHVRVAIDVDPAEVTIVIEDGGKPFDPFREQRPIDFDDIGSLPCGGFGLSLIRQICDSVDYENQGQGNRLTLRKGLAAPCSAAEAGGSR